LISFDYIIYTDGACLGNPGPGGWAALIIDKNELTDKKVGSEISTTNNRMELTAVIEALKIIPSESKLAVYTDSKYVINGIEIWIVNWKKSNWKGSNRKEIKNKDLWIQLDNLSQNLNINWNWVKGHSGDVNNEEVDQLARGEAEKLDIV
jgi:ribonuclease HI